jgi:hypothetical protein
MALQTKHAEKVRPNQKKLDAVSYVETSLYTRAAVSKKVPAMKASIRTTLANKTPAKKFSSSNGDDKSEVDEMQDPRLRKLQTRKFQ